MWNSLRRLFRFHRNFCLRNITDFGNDSNYNQLKEEHTPIDCYPVFLHNLA